MFFNTSANISNVKKCYEEKLVDIAMLQNDLVIIALTKKPSMSETPLTPLVISLGFF